MIRISVGHVSTFMITIKSHYFCFKDIVSQKMSVEKGILYKIITICSNSSSKCKQSHINYMFNRYTCIIHQNTSKGEKKDPVGSST